MQNMGELKKLIINRIVMSGPISVSEYMETCLTHPLHGYYCRKPVFGGNGDFTTSPEISQMFGEIMGLWMVKSWLDQGSPQKIILLELGPGRGTLLNDALRAASKVPDFLKSMQIYLLEKSYQMRQTQKNTLKKFNLTWIENLSQLPEYPLFFIANEFFDALPIKQYKKIHDVWRERLISAKRDKLILKLSDLPLKKFELANWEGKARHGDIIEIRPEAQELMFEIATRITTFGGAGLIIDYGGWNSLGDTIQAVKGHKYVDWLDTPGEADITAHVDFKALSANLPCRHSHLLNQGLFLERLGITKRAQTLCKGMKCAQLEEHIAAHRRLTHPSEMGNLFKVMALYPKSVSSIEGF